METFPVAMTDPVVMEVRVVTLISGVYCDEAIASKKA